jgi:predicted phosphodiesterase
MIGVVSDTHDNIDAVEGIVEAFENRGVGTVVHCGDYIAPPVIPYFDGFELHGVLGNNDGEIDGLETAFEAIGGSLHGRFLDLNLDGTTVLNPGGHFPTVPDEHRTVALVDGDEVEFVGVG